MMYKKSLSDIENTVSATDLKVKISTPRLIISKADLSVGGSVEFIGDLLSQSHVREGLFSMASQSLLFKTKKIPSIHVAQRDNLDEEEEEMSSKAGRKRSSVNRQLASWNEAAVNKLVEFWQEEEVKGYGCGLYLIYHKEKENVNLALQLSNQEETYPPRKTIRTRNDRHSISGPSIYHDSKTFKTVHGRRIGASLESRLPIGLVAVSYTDSSTRMLDLVISADHQGEGYATEASKAILRHFLSPPPLHLPLSIRNLFSPSSLDNSSSSLGKREATALVTKFSGFVEQGSDRDLGWWRVLEKLGFKHTSSSLAINNVKVDVCSITRDEFIDLWMDC